MGSTVLKKISEKFFVNILSNLVLFFVVAVVVYVSFGEGFITAFTTSEPPIYNGNTEKKNVSLMINVYWGTEYLDGMLEVLEENEVKVTFFVGGSWANKNSLMLEKLHNGGHEIANHGFFHKDHKKLSYAGNQEEIVTCEKVVFTMIGVKTNLFAPPSGAYNNTTLKAASDLGYKTIMWSKDTIDWRDKDENLVYSRATKDVKNGDLVLMHPTEHTYKALDKIIKNYKKNGFSVVTVTENLY